MCTFRGTFAFNASSSAGLCGQPTTINIYSSGFTVVDMDQYFDQYRNGDENTTGYFDIVVKHNNKTATGYTRCRIHTTAVETIYLPN